MRDPLEGLLLELLAWIGPEPRPYAECLDAWRTSCPRLPVWEEATDRGFLRRRRGHGGEPVVELTRLGREHLASHAGAGGDASRSHPTPSTTPSP